MFKKILSVIVLIGVFAACGFTGKGSDPRLVMDRSYSLQGLNFSALAGLTVSEDVGYYPSADVVWRGDAPGDRIAQIGSMFETAAQRNRGVIQGRQPVVVDVELVRFHGLTEKTRATVGGVYNIVFNFTVRDARTGEVIEPKRRIVADLPGPGGSQAFALEHQGRTERVQVTEFLTSILRRELI